MDRQLAGVAITFMQRMKLSGNEVPAFTAVLNALTAIAAGRTVVVDAQLPRGDQP